MLDDVRLCCKLHRSAPRAGRMSGSNPKLMSSSSSSRSSSEVPATTAAIGTAGCVTVDWKDCRQSLTVERRCSLGAAVPLSCWAAARSFSLRDLAASCFSRSAGCFEQPSCDAATSCKPVLLPPLPLPVLRSFASSAPATLDPHASPPWAPASQLELGKVDLLRFPAQAQPFSGGK